MAKIDLGTRSSTKSCQRGFLVAVLRVLPYRHATFAFAKRPTRSPIAPFCQKHAVSGVVYPETTWLE
jgi:hypothetical protein